MSAFINPCILVLVSIICLEAREQPYCASVEGKSSGAGNFCENCSDYNKRLGIGVYWIKGALGARFLSAATASETNYVQIQVTSIQIDGKALKGWFHFRIRIDDGRPFYAYLIQVEDEENRRVVGEFTTELGAMCESRGELKNTPTQSQILPCHSVYRDQLTPSNSVAYYRYANLTENIIRASDSNEIHLNWKFPAGNGCSFSKRLLIRAELFSTPGGDPETCTTGNCEPVLHIHKRHVIHMPDFELGGQFHKADPLPLFIFPNTVNCQLAIPKPKGSTTSYPEPYIQEIGIREDCTTHPYNRRNFLEGFAGSLNCRQPTYTSPEGGYCAIGGITKKNYDIEIASRGIVGSFLGRCLPDVNSDRVHVSPAFPLTCRKPDAYDQLVGQYTDNSDHKPDFDFIATLESPLSYVKSIRIDTCNCYPDRRGGGDASLRRRLASTVPPKVQPPADYPVVVEEANPGQKKLLSASFSESGVNKSAKESPNYPTRIISKYARRAHMTHGALIAFAFMFFLPVGIFIARFLKESTHNMTLLTYDCWYQAHVFMILAAFFCVVCGTYLTGALTYWRTEGVSTTKHPKLHKNIGWITVAIFMVTLICGPFRSMLCIKVSVIIHSVAGDISYYFGLLTLFVYLFGFKDEGNDGFFALWILAFWFFVDVGFRVGMTLLMLKMDRKDGVKRNFYPAIELVVVDRNASGRMIRMIAFVIYASLSLICTFAFLAFTWWAHERVDADVFISDGSDRRNRY